MKINLFLKPVPAVDSEVRFSKITAASIDGKVANRRIYG